MTLGTLPPSCQPPFGAIPSPFPSSTGPCECGCTPAGPPTANSTVNGLAYWANGQASQLFSSTATVTADGDLSVSALSIAGVPFTGGAGGVNTEVQWNLSGALSGSTALTWNNTTNTLGLTGPLQLAPTPTTPAQGSLFIDGTHNNGMILWAYRGSGSPTIDFGLLNAANTEFVMTVPSNTANVVFGTVGGGTSATFNGTVTLGANNTALLLTDSGSNPRRAFLLTSANSYDVGDIDNIGYSTQLFAGSAGSINNFVNTVNVGSFKATGLTLPLLNTAGVVLNSAAGLLSTSIGANGTFLSTSGGVVGWTAGSSTAGGSTTQVQFNSGGTLGGASTFTWSGTVLSVPNITLSGIANTQVATSVSGTLTGSANLTFSGGTLVVSSQVSVPTVSATASNLALISGTGSVSVGVGGGTTALTLAGTTGNATFSGNVLSSSATGGIGYTQGNGAGGTVTQLTNKTTPFTLSKITGQITFATGALAGDTTATATWTNTAIANVDVVVFNHIAGGTIGAYTFNAVCGAGTASISIHNCTPGSLTETPVVQYIVLKGSIT
jgi:hypothetical protein